MDNKGYYFDTSYLVRLYLQDPGFQEVRALAAHHDTITSAWHAKIEIIAALHRAFREKRLTEEAYRAALKQYQEDSEGRHFDWLTLDKPIQLRLEDFFWQAPASVFLRAADALHLACAAENGFTEVYSNDRHLLAAAPLFGLIGRNVIPISS